MINNPLLARLDREDKDGTVPNHQCVALTTVLFLVTHDTRTHSHCSGAQSGAKTSSSMNSCWLDFAFSHEGSGKSKGKEGGW